MLRLSLRTCLFSVLFLLTFAASLGGANVLELQTTAFKPGSEIPGRFACTGANESPALSWTSAPSGTKSFALILDDPDAPSGTFTHWLVYAIPANAKSLAEAAPKTDELSDGSRQGRNDFGRAGYGGPCPPPGKPHRYFFKLYALDVDISLPAGSTRAELEKALAGHVLAKAEIMGTYRR